MKTLSKTFAAAVLILSAAAFTSCKDKEVETTETDTTIVEDTSSMAVDTTQMAPVNDTNVSGVTSGKMEQVP